MPEPHRADDEPSESRRAQRHHHRVAAKRRRLILLLSAVTLAAGIGAVVAVFVARDTDERKDPSFLLVLQEYNISGTLVVGAGDVKFAVANIGKVPHNVGVRGGPRTADLFPDQAWHLELRGLQPGTYELFCDMTGHEARGMVATLQVVEAGAPPIPTG